MKQKAKKEGYGRKLKNITINQGGGRYRKMIKKRYIDGLLDALQYEAIKLFIKQGEVDIAFKEKIEENKDIENLIKRIKLDTQVGDYRVVINYELKIIEIFKGNKLEIITNFGKYGVTGLWTMVLEEIEKLKGE